MKFSLIKYLSQKIRLTVSRANTGKELLHVNASRFIILFWSLVFLLLFVILIIFLTLRTPLANYIPGFHGKKSQQAIVEALYKLDSLTSEVNRWESYNENLLLILNGDNSITDIVDSIKKTDRKIVPKTILDSMFRERFLKDSILQLSGNRKRSKDFFELLPPASGMVTSNFNPANGIFGITMNPQPSSAILAVMDGTVVNTSWSPTDNWTITLQHYGGFISIYKSLAEVLLTTGQHVNAGETIGIAPSMNPGSTPKLEFELWQNGNVVDPENYITF